MVPELDRRRSRSMGTDVELVGPAGHGALDTAAAIVARTFAREDLRCSRFRRGSELSRVNARAGRPTKVSPPFAEIVGLALAAAQRTGGRFDPTLLDAVIAAGYDRDFDDLLAGARVAVRGPARPGGRWRDVVLDGSRLTLPAGVGLDLGGIAKGWTVDLAAEAALDAGLPWALVNAGGDLRIAGSPPGTLEIAIEDPEDARAELGRVRVTNGALATTSVTKRAWGDGAHHLIDPSTGLPSTGEVLQATVWAPTCAEAEVLAKVAALEGERALPAAPAALVLRDGRVLSSFGSDGVAEEAA